MDVEEELVVHQKKRITVLSSEEEEELNETFYGNEHSNLQTAPLMTITENEYTQEDAVVPLVAPPQESVSETEQTQATGVNSTPPSMYDTDYLC